GIWSSAMARTKWHSGTSRCGTSQTLISGPEVRSRRRISSCTTTRRARSRERVGGPATAQAAWVDAFLAHTKEANVPVDFASTHVYGNDSAEDVFGTHENIPRTQM